MIETDSITLEKGRLRKYPLKFEDPLLEKDFLTEFGDRALKHLKANYPYVVITILLGEIIFFFYNPGAIIINRAWLAMFTILAVSGIMFRVFPGREKLMQMYIAIVGTLLGLFYVSGLVLLEGHFLIPYIWTAVGIHLMFMCLCTPMRFSYVISISIVLPLAYIITAAVTQLFQAQDLLLHIIIGGGLTSFSLIVAYQREWLTRIEFIQRLVIEAREKSLAREKERSEALLLNILPSSIADQLKGGRKPIADMFDNVSVLFVDIVGFTPLSKNLAANEVVDILNEIFHLFDDLAVEYGLEKIKTIGDAYMVAAGLPEPRPDHADAIAKMAIGIREAVTGYSKRSGRQLQVRIGINSGPVVAGVIGKTKFAYDLWGDTVNTASRMESHGIPGEIQVAPPTFELLKDNFEFDARGEIEVKGHGPMETFMLKKALA
ncbi:adenylate/guanylate cyclase domain-containing protein [Planctomycetota bacterium]